MDKAKRSGSKPKFTAPVIDSIPDPTHVQRRVVDTIAAATVEQHSKRAYRDYKTWEALQDHVNHYQGRTPTEQDAFLDFGEDWPQMVKACKQTYKAFRAMRKFLKKANAHRPEWQSKPAAESKQEGGTVA